MTGTGKLDLRPPASLTTIGEHSVHSEDFPAAIQRVPPNLKSAITPRSSTRQRKKKTVSFQGVSPLPLTPAPASSLKSKKKSVSFQGVSPLPHTPAPASSSNRSPICVICKSRVCRCNYSLNDAQSPLGLTVYTSPELENLR